MIVVVYGPQASGKTRNKGAIQKHFGYVPLIDGVTRIGRSGKFVDDSGKIHSRVPDNAVILTNMTESECRSFIGPMTGQTVRLIPIEEMKRILA